MSSELVQSSFSLTNALKTSTLFQDNKELSYLHFFRGLFGHRVKYGLDHWTLGPLDYFLDHFLDYFMD